MTVGTKRVEKGESRDWKSRPYHRKYIETRECTMERVLPVNYSDKKLLNLFTN